MLSEKSYDNWRNESSKIDPHIEDRKACIAALVLVRIQLTDHRTDIGLQQPGADSNQNQAGIKRWHATDGHRIVTASDDDAAYQNGPPRSQNAIRQPASDERQIPDRRNISRVDHAGIFFVEAKSAFHQALRHIERQDCLHTVVTEAFPHLGEEQGRQAARVTKETAIVSSGSRTSASAVNCSAHMFP